MIANNPCPRIAYVSTYVPKKCGLATYTHHLREAVHRAAEDGRQDLVVAVCNEEERPDYREPWMLPLLKSDPEAYRLAAEMLNQSPVEIVSLQHEFGIFGGVAGEYVCEFLERLEKPVAATFHTVFETPPEPYASIQRRIAHRCDHLIVMNRRAVGFLHENFDIPTGKISFIPHGAPFPNRSDRIGTRRAHGWENRSVLFTFGLLGRSKGIEFALRALAKAVRAVPELLYVIAGETHPEVRRHEGEAYREELAALIRELGLEHHVQMINRYIPEEELAALMTAADLYVTPYPGMQQITSGTLAYAAGLGRPILSTPYCYAIDLVQGHEDMLLPFGDVEAWSAKIIELFSYTGLLGKWERTMAEIGRSMHWPQAGAQHLRLFGEILRGQGTTVAGVG
jgi:glycosyltransferase involved in cell wall biosynthesis